MVEVVEEVEMVAVGVLIEEAVAEEEVDAVLELILRLVMVL